MIVIRDVFTIRPPDEIKTKVAEAGFDNVQLDSPSDQKVHYIVAQRSPKSQPAVG